MDILLLQDIPITNGEITGLNFIPFRTIMPNELGTLAVVVIANPEIRVMTIKKNTDTWLLRKFSLTKNISQYHRYTTNTVYQLLTLPEELIPWSGQLTRL